MNEEEMIQTLDEAMLYAHIQCSKHACQSCPAFGKTSMPGNTDNCELYFMVKYLEENKIILLKED